jgi:hypothetical protein
VSASAATPSRLAFGAVLAAVVVSPDWLVSLPSLCPFRWVTGFPCPGCGLTRSVVAAAHGDLGQALAFHPLGLAILLVLLGLSIAGLRPVRVSPGPTSLRARDPSGEEGVLRGRARRWLPWLASGALLLVWLVRLPLFVAGRWVY